VSDPTEGSPGKKVLVIDDDPLFCALAVGLLEMQGYKGIVAPDGGLALEMIRDRGDEIEAVLVDYTMRPMNGRQILAKINSLRPGMPVVMMSGSAKEDLPEAAEQAAFPGFLQKPFSSEALGQAIQRASAANQPR
jgi:DNA-binding NtrC family response regulator